MHYNNHFKYVIDPETDAIFDWAYMDRLWPSISYGIIALRNININKRFILLVINVFLDTCFVVFIYLWEGRMDWMLNSANTAIGTFIEGYGKLI